MRRIFALCTVCLLFQAGAVFAQAGQGGSGLLVDLAIDHIDITTGFNGSDLILFGTKNAEGEIAVVVRGPEKDMTVRRKDQVGGAWLNRHSVLFEDVPAYYDYALSAPEEGIAPAAVLKEYGIGLQALELQASEKYRNERHVVEFRKALIRNKISDGLFAAMPQPVIFLNEHFFRTTMHVPANVPRGEYRIETYLIRDGQIRDSYATTMRVGHIGLSAGIYKFAYGQSLFYGIVCVLIAGLSGWFVNALRQKE